MVIMAKHVEGSRLITTEDGSDLVEGDAIALDVMYTDAEGLTAALTELTEGTAVETEVILEHGPAGGWPLVRFSGPVGELRTVVKRYNALKN
jgi:hypothetical protein